MAEFEKASDMLNFIKREKRNKGYSERLCHGKIYKKQR
jgi:hypothetical protein